MTRLLARAPVQSPPSGKQAWTDWQYYRSNWKQRAVEMAPGLAENMTSAEAIEYGAEFVAWLESVGEAALAARALETMERAWWTRYSTDPASGAPTTLPSRAASSVLVDTGRDLAVAGRHDEAIQVLTRAFLLVQMQLEDATRDRVAEIDAAPDETHVDMRRPVAYTVVGQLYDRMREILAIYPKLTRSLRSAGKTAEADQAASEGARLRDELRANFTLEHPELSEDLTGRAMITEFTHADTAHGPALRIHGANWTDEDVTALPGLPDPAEIRGRIQYSSLSGTGAALAEQVDLLEELLARPEVMKAFPTGDINLRDRDQRLKVWGAVFPVLRAQLGDDEKALTALMALMQRYLRGFTVHTDYNIRDFGTSYLDSDMPEDLAGRAERDCGVYALTVAFEVFRVARAAGAPKLDFSLVSVPGHVMLAIQLRGTDTVFVVNNDEIEGPHHGTIEDLAARFIAPIFKHRYIVTPAMSLPMGSTDMTTAQFKSGAWNGLLDTASWGLNVGPGPPGETPAALRARTQTVYEDFYGGLDTFDRICTSLQAKLDVAASSHSISELAGQLEQLRPQYLRAFTLLGLLLNTRWAGDEQHRPGVEQRLTPHSKILISQPTATPPHPLVRVAMGLLRLQSLGVKLGAEDQALVTFMSTFSPFDVPIAAFVKAGSPATF